MAFFPIHAWIFYDCSNFPPLQTCRMVLVVVNLLLDILCFTGQVCNGSRNMAMASGFLEAGRQLVVCSQARSAMVAEIMDS